MKVDAETDGTGYRNITWNEIAAEKRRTRHFAKRNNFRYLPQYSTAAMQQI